MLRTEASDNIRTQEPDTSKALGFFRKRFRVEWKRREVTDTSHNTQRTQRE